MQKARAICVALFLATLIQIITACGGGDGGSGNTPVNTYRGSGEDAGTPAENATVAGMLDTSTPGTQHMQSLNYIAEGQISFGATTEVYATSGKYRLQAQPPILPAGY